MPKWFSKAPGFHIPARSFKRGLGHTMTAHRLHKSPGIRGSLDFAFQNHRRQELFQCGPGAFHPFVAVERTFSRGALAPAFDAVCVNNSGKNDATFSRSAKTCLEEVNQRQTNFT